MSPHSTPALLRALALACATSPAAAATVTTLSETLPASINEGENVLLNYSLRLNGPNSSAIRSAAYNYSSPDMYIGGGYITSPTENWASCPSSGYCTYGGTYANATAGVHNTDWTMADGYVRVRDGTGASVALQAFVTVADAYKTGGDYFDFIDPVEVGFTLANVTVLNVAPSLVSARLGAYVGDTLTGYEGASTYLRVTAQDPGADAVKLRVNYQGQQVETGFDSAVAGSRNLFSPTFTLGDGAPGGTATSATVTLTDDDGGTRVETVNITVLNRAPVISGTGHGADATGSALTLSGSAYDPGGDDFDLAWSLNGAGLASGLLGDGKTVRFLSAGSYAFRIDATDDEGAQSSRSFTRTVSGGAPGAPDGRDQVARLAAGSPVLLMQALDVSLVEVDPLDLVQLTFDYRLTGNTAAGGDAPQAQVMLGGALLGVLDFDPSGAVMPGFASATLDVSPDLFDLDSLLFEFLFDGPAGSVLEVDDFALMVNGVTLAGLFENAGFETGDLTGFLAIGAEGASAMAASTSVPLPAGAALLPAGIAALAGLSAARRGRAPLSAARGRV